MSLAIDHRLQHVQLSGSDGLLQGRQIVHAYPRQCEHAHDGDEGRATQQQHDLDTLRHHHCLQAAQRGIGNREQREYKDGGKHRYAEQSLKDLGGRKQADADVDEQRAEDANHCQESTRRGTIAALHEFRQRGHAGVDIERSKHQRQQDEDEARHPLEVADDQTVSCTTGRVANQVDGRNVRGEHGRTDGEPAERFVGQEVLLGGRIPAIANFDAEGGDANQVNSDDDGVDRSDGHALGLDLHFQSRGLVCGKVQGFHRILESKDVVDQRAYVDASSGHQADRFIETCHRSASIRGS